MKIAVLPSQADARPDFWKLLEFLSKQSNLVVLTKDGDVVDTNLFATRRVIGNRNSIYCRILRRVWSVFGQLSAVKENFIINELFRNSSKGGLEQKFYSICNFIRTITPLSLSLRTYLRLLSKVDKTDLSDFDAVLFISEISDNCILARAKKFGLKTYLYVYSWDHIGKHTNIPTDFDGYFVWNERVKQDLIEIGGISEEKIYVVGSTQLASLYEFKKTKQTKIRNTAPIIYFGCAVGYKSLAKTEVDIAIHIYRQCERHFQDFTFLFRPYPFLLDWDLYDEIKSFKNVKIDAWERRKESWRTMSEDTVYQRYERLDSADLFFHIGTTMGLECCFFGTPAVLIDLSLGSEFHNMFGNSLTTYFSDQYHILRHLKYHSFDCVVGSDNKLNSVLESVKDEEKWLSLTEYNSYVIDGFQLRDNESIALNVLSIMNQDALKMNSAKFGNQSQKNL